MNRKGWCPSLFAPMQSGDGWLVRLRPRDAALSAAEARAIADAAARHGSGILDLTQRGNLQIRGLSPASAVSFATELAGAGLAQAQAGPNLLVSPLAGDDPGVHPQTAAIADAIAGSDCGRLADKFLFVIDGGGAIDLADIRADITLRAGNGGWTVGIDGEALFAACDPARLPEAARNLARAFAERSGGDGRMRDLVRSRGSRELFQAAGLSAEFLPTPASASDPIGFLPYRIDQDGFALGGFALGVAFGALDAEALRRLAWLAERHGDARLRITPWRSVILTGVGGSHAALPSDAGDGFITDGNDPRRGVIACPGKPGCASATVHTRADAALLTGGVRLAGRIHVSGCAKGCAHPGPAPVTLVGDLGTYRLIRNGSAAGVPEQAGLTMAQAVRVLAGTA